MYKFKSVHDWLYKTYPDLPTDVVLILNLVDADTIQDVCQDHMDDDGYFENEED